MCFAPGSTFLAIGQTDGKVTIIDCSTWLAIAEFAASPEGITAMAISPDGLALVTASGFVKTTIEVWALPTLAHVSTLRGHESWVSALAFDPSQQRLASASGDQTVRLWNTATWEQISILRGHSDEVYTVAFSRDGKQLLSGSKAGELLLWASDVQGHSHFTEFPVPISNFAFIGEKSKMLILQQNGKLVLAAGGEQFTPLPVGSGDPDAKLAIQNESTTVAIAAKSGLTIWDWNEKRRIKTLAGENSSPVFVQFTSGYPHRLVLVDSIGRIRQWNTADWRESNVWTLDLKVNAAALSRDGIHLAIGCIDGTLETVDLVAKRVLGSVRGHQRVITSLDYNSDGSLLLTSSEDSLVKVWESSTLRTNAVLRGHLLGVHSTVFAPDDTRIVSASHDRQAIKVWDATTYEELVTLKGDGSFFHRTAFSHDGHTLASLNGKGILHIWTID
jgi:WD40 repeat protein